jgi:hypothetical protein
VPVEVFGQGDLHDVPQVFLDHIAGIVVAPGTTR